MRYATIDAHKVWHGDAQECRRLYRQFKEYYRGNFYKICKHYGWKKHSMLAALRLGKN